MEKDEEIENIDSDTVEESKETEESTEATETTESAVEADNLENADSETVEESLEASETEDKELDTELEEVKETKIVGFEDILGDELLPEHSNENNNLQKKLKDLQKMSKNSVESGKFKISYLLIFIIVVVGLILVFVNLKKGEIVEESIIIYELPTYKLNVFSSEDNSPHNVQLNVSLGIKSSDLKNLNTEACYNTVYDIVSVMDYEDFASDSSQFIVKQKVKEGIKEDENFGIDVRVYVSGIDVGKTNMSGFTADTQADTNQNKGANIVDKLQPSEEGKTEENKTSETTNPSLPTTN